jgi:Tol biopolymer transport system component/TRAP-type C4-dicarboxylate transport system substrate-binding protein
MSKKNHLIQIIVFLIAVIALSACAPQVADSSTETSLTLRLAVSDEQGYPSEPLVLEFIDQVKKLSNGNIIIEPTWDAGKNTTAGFETGVIQLVWDGKADLGLAASRAWDTQGITSFQALQAPFLIDNDALAEAVATSDIAAKMLDSLSKNGIMGLTLWPEDLRHPFSLLPEKPILSPADISGRNIRVTDTGVSQKLIETLGGIPTTGEGGYEGAESGLRQARSLSGTPTATGNVTFFPKYQVLFANGAAFSKLSEAQQALLREAAAATQKKAIAEHPSEVEAAKTWCSDVGAVVLASDEQIAAFEKAAQPVFDWIEQDPLNGELVAAIKELKGKTPPSPGAQACEPELAQQIPTPDASAQTWSTGLPPNGVWQVTLTNDEVIKMGVSKAKAPEWSGVYTFTFQDGVFHWTWEGTEDYAKGQTASADGSYEVVEDFVRMTSGDVVDDVQWRLDEEGLHFHLLATQNDPFVEIRAMFEARPYQKVGDDTSSSSTTSTSPESFAGETVWIVYQSDRSGSEGVWLIHPDGTEDHQMNANGMTVLLPDWSPDGKRLVVASRGGETEPIYEYDLNTETFRQLFACEDPCLGDDEPTYSPDGTKVVFVRAQLPIVYSDAIGDDVPGNCSLWIGDVATGETKQITNNPACNREYNPRWSPDGTQLVYWRNPYENGRSTGTAVYVMNADGTNERQVTDPTMFGGEADWSHDGQWIVFATYPLAEFNSTAKVSNLYRIHPDGTGLEQLTFNESTNLRATQPRYTPDGNWIIFTAVTSSSRSLWVIPAEGGDPIVIVEGGIYTHGAWQP